MITATLWSRCSGYPGTEDYYQAYLSRYAHEPDYHRRGSVFRAFGGGRCVAACRILEQQKHPDGPRRHLHHDTVRGRVKFYSYDNFERQNTVRTIVLQLVGGRFTCIWPPDIAEGKFIYPAKGLRVKGAFVEK